MIIANSALRASLAIYQYLRKTASRKFCTGMPTFRVGQYIPVLSLFLARPKPSPFSEKSIDWEIITENLKIKKPVMFTYGSITVLRPLRR